MRFKLNDHLLFLTIDPRNSDQMKFIPHLDDIEKIHLTEVKVIHHQAVPNQYGGDVAHDGYVMQLIRSDLPQAQYFPIWHNQYPRATYGQIDDSNDWKIYPSLSDSVPIAGNPHAAISHSLPIHGRVLEASWFLNELYFLCKFSKHLNVGEVAKIQSAIEAVIGQIHAQSDFVVMYEQLRDFQDVITYSVVKRTASQNALGDTSLVSAFKDAK